MTGPARRQPLSRPLARLSAFDAEPWRSPEDTIRFADAMIARGWRAPGDHLASIAPPIPWGRGGRSFAMHVHSWLPLKDIMAAHHMTGERRYLDAAFAMALDWARAHPRFTRREQDAGDGSEDSFAWYDQAVGLRLCRLAYILDAAWREKDIPAGDIAALEDSFRQHVAVISDDQEFREHTNHGLYQALGQLSAALRFAGLDDLAPPEFLAQARARFDQMLHQQYFAEGMHREHSPGYHFATWRALSAAVADGLVEAPELQAMLDNIETSLSWLFDGKAAIATIGDTDPWEAPLPERLTSLHNARLRAVLSRQDVDGAVIAGFPQSGYAGVQYYRDGLRSFLLQMAGFHSLTHKHADHLGFVWSEQDTDILIDPGRWGYRGRTQHGSDLFKLGFWYDAPERVFVESTHAHNVVQADEQEFPRRGVTPFGSGLQAWGESGGYYYILSKAPLTGDATQRRLLLLSPGDFLLVVDFAEDRMVRSWRQWFHLGASFAATEREGSIHASNEAGVSLFALPLAPGQKAGAVMTGQYEPFTQGWWCPEPGVLKPAPAFAMAAPDGKQALFATLFTFAGEAAALPASCQGNMQQAELKLAWRQDGQERSLSLHLAGDTVTIA